MFQQPQIASLKTPSRSCSARYHAVIVSRRRYGTTRNERAACQARRRPQPLRARGRLSSSGWRAAIAGHPPRRSLSMCLPSACLIQVVRKSIWPFVHRTARHTHFVLRRSLASYRRPSRSRAQLHSRSAAQSRLLVSSSARALPLASIGARCPAPPPCLRSACQHAIGTQEITV